MILALLFSLCNRARGSHVWNIIPSTLASRLLATLGMTIAVVYCTGLIRLIALWPLLFLWSIPAWDAYWSAMLGHDIHHSKLWGYRMMVIRMSLFIPVLAVAAHFTHGSYWPIFGIPLLPLPYLLTASLYNPVPKAEYLVGAALGILVLLAIQ